VNKRRRFKAKRRRALAAKLASLARDVPAYHNYRKVTAAEAKAFVNRQDVREGLAIAVGRLHAELGG